MIQIIDKSKLYQLGIGMFGILSICIIQTIIYEKLIMFPFSNFITSKSQYFPSQAGFVFLQKTIAWLFAQIFAFCTTHNHTKIHIPVQYTFFCGLFAFISSILFTTGIFELNFRLSFSNRTSTYLIVTIIGWIGSRYISPSKSPKIRDLFSGIGIGLGIIIFWVFGQDLWVYTPTKNGYIYNWMVVSSGISDGVLALLQSWVCEKFNPNSTNLLISVSKSTAAWSFLYVFLTKDILKTIDFCYFHPQFSFNILIYGLFYYLIQIFIYRVTTQMSQNVPAFITTSSKVLIIHQSYMLSSHKIHTKQMIGIIISWISILAQAFLFIKSQKKSAQTFRKIPLDQVQMRQLSSDEITIVKN